MKIDLRSFSKARWPIIPSQRRLAHTDGLGSFLQAKNAGITGYSNL